MAWNLRLFPAYQNWVDARNRRIIEFLWVGRRFKEPEFKIWVYFEQFLTQRARRWSSFIENFVDRLLEELGVRGYIKRLLTVTVTDKVGVTDLDKARPGYPQGAGTEFYTEYLVKGRLTLGVLEEMIYQITPYLDPE